MRMMVYVVLARNMIENAGVKSIKSVHARAMGVGVEQQ